MRTGIRRAPKAQERTLVKAARRIAKNPELLFPKCVSGCAKCPFTKPKKRLARLSEFKDDDAKLKRLARRGDMLSRAYATSLLIARSGKAPYLAVAKLPQGDIPYAVRGNVKKEYLLGLQHYEDPILRLLAFVAIAKKHKLYLYSGEKFYCSKGRPTPPSEFVSEMLHDLKLCEHKTDRLTINWRSADVCASICKDCAGETNSYTYITSHILAPKDDDLKVTMVYEPYCKSDCDHCPVRETSEKDALQRDYVEGKLTDRQAINEYVARVKAQLKKGKQRVLIIKDTCYGGDVHAFIEALVPTPEERTGLEYVLKTFEGAIIIDEKSPNAVLSLYWVAMGVDILTKITGDERLAKELFKPNGIPTQLVREAKLRVDEINALSKYPVYGRLPECAAVADKAVRRYKARGKNEALRLLATLDTDEHRIRALCYGFKLALGEKGEEWRYSDTEIEFGEFLKTFVKLLIDAEPDHYHERLQELLKATGSTEAIQMVDEQG